MLNNACRRFLSLFFVLLLTICHVLCSSQISIFPALVRHGNYKTKASHVSLVFLNYFLWNGGFCICYQSSHHHLVPSFFCTTVFLILLQVSLNKVQPALWLVEYCSGDICEAVYLSGSYWHETMVHLVLQLAAARAWGILHQEENGPCSGPAGYCVPCCAPHIYDGMSACRSQYWVFHWRWPHQDREGVFAKRWVSTHFRNLMASILVLVVRYTQTQLIMWILHIGLSSSCLFFLCSHPHLP